MDSFLGSAMDCSDSVCVEDSTSSSGAQCIEEDPTITSSSSQPERASNPPTATVLVDYPYSSSDSEEDTTVDFSPPSLSPKHNQPTPLESQVLHELNTSASITTISVSAYEQQPSTHSLSPPPSSPTLSTHGGPGVLGQVMGCVIRLRLSLERLIEKGLVAQHIASSLISAIENTEELYETKIE